MLHVNQLTKYYGERRVVDNLSFAVNQGEVFCLLGSNGAGKSTTLRMLLGMTPASAGSATLDDDDLLVGNSLAQRLYIPENVNLYDDFNALENIHYLAAIARIKVDTAAITTALDRVGLDGVHHKKVLGQYSKGMRQKVIIAFALLKNARLLLLDEPTSGLDPIATRDFIRLIKELTQQGCIVLMVTHDLQCAHRLADRVGVMHQGSLKAVRSAADIELSDIEHLYFDEHNQGNNHV